MFEYTADLIDVIDADTLKLRLDLGFSVFVKMSCRLARINAPEMTTLDGAKAKQFVIDTLATAINLKASTSKPDKYGRWLVELHYQTAATGAQWLNLSDVLLNLRIVAPYP